MAQSTSFISADLKINSLSDIKPYLTKLIDSPISSVGELETFLRQYSDVLSIYREQEARAYIEMTRYTDDEANLKRHEMFTTEISPEVQILTNQIDKKITESPYYTNLDGTFYGPFKRSLKRELELFREANVKLEAELAQLGTKYNQITGALTATVEGKEMPLPQAQAYLMRSERAIRQEAWFATQEARLKVTEELDTLFTDMVKLRDNVAKNAGYKNYRDYKHDELERFDYTVTDVKNFHVAVRDSILPLAKEIAKQHKKKIGLENDYRPWDALGQPQGQEPLKPFRSGKELLDKSIAVFSELRPEFGDNLRKMEASGLFDLESRKGKAPGGYNYGLEVTGMPFIFMNAVGIHRDMVTLMHEGGHAMHTFLTAKEPLIFYRDTPSEMAETASMSMELMTSTLWSAFYDNKDLVRARREHLEDIIGFFPWCAIVDKFQHWIYENPSHTSMERNAYYVSLLDEFGSGATDWTGLEHFRRSSWQKQLHIFEVPFYYIEYGIAQLGSLQVYRNFVKDPQKGLDGYMAGLKLGSSKPIPEVWKAMGIQFDFSPTMIRELMEFVQSELEKLV